MLQVICLQICEDIDEEKCLSIDVQTCETVTNDVRRQIIKIFILIILVINHQDYDHHLVFNGIVFISNIRCAQM